MRGDQANGATAALGRLRACTPSVLGTGGTGGCLSREELQAEAKRGRASTQRRRRGGELWLCAVPLMRRDVRPTAAFYHRLLNSFGLCLPWQCHQTSLTTCLGQANGRTRRSSFKCTRATPCRRCEALHMPYTELAQVLQRLRWLHSGILRTAPMLADVDTRRASVPIRPKGKGRSAGAHHQGSTCSVAGYLTLQWCRKPRPSRTTDRPQSLVTPTPHGGTQARQEHSRAAPAQCAGRTNHQRVRAHHLQRLQAGGQKTDDDDVHAMHHTNQTKTNTQTKRFSHSNSISTITSPTA